MGMRRFAEIVAAGALMLTAGTAAADYYSHPGIRPGNRCITATGQSFAAAGIDPINCQKLFWDIPATTKLGVVAVEAPYNEDSIPRFPNGISDRIPPIWVGTLASGKEEGFERQQDCQANASGCHRLCSDPEAVPFWKPILEADGKTQKIGQDPTGKLHSVDDPTKLQSGPLVQTACQRGSRAYFGPWQTGTDQAKFDGTTSNNMIRFENTSRLNQDVANGATTEARRLEWNTSTEFYNHFGSHHGTCYQPSDACADVNGTKPRSAYDANDPNATCYKYEASAEPTSGCYSADEDPGCSGGVGMGGFRNATQLPGRLSVPLPDGRGVLGTEDQIWGCNHHTVTQLPPGSYSMTKLANYRLQKGGLINTKDKPINGAAPGQVIGGTVGEMIMQYLTEPLNANVKPISVMFNAAADDATTYYPPFTWNYHEAEWFAPYDAQIALGAIHSHHRMVKGIMNPAGGFPPRVNSPNPLCGGVMNPTADTVNAYTDWYWEDAPVCEWWKDADGTIPLRKGQAWRTTCYINNGITPEAIKHGLVAGAAVEALKTLGAPIPDYPKLVAANTWGDALAGSPLGRELLYGTHPPINYRVKYTCGSDPVTTGTRAPVIGHGKNCNANAAVDQEGDYIDGAYLNEAQCGAGGYCNPSAIVFACVGEEEMCIGVTMYFAMPRPLNSDGSPNEGFIAEAQAAHVNNLGTPGNTGLPTDVLVGGNCPDCKAGL